MFLSNTHRKQFALYYFICFTIYYTWYFYHGLLLHQLRPVFFHNRLDMTVNVLMLTNLHIAVINSPFLQMLFDSLYFLLPLLLCMAIFARHRLQYFLAILTAVFNLVYAVLISSTSPLSMEGFSGWIMLPLLFAFKSEQSFYYILHTLRYFFLLIFSSAALWKIRAGGIFNLEQMGAILVKQHAAYLVGQPNDWFAGLIRYLVNHQKLSYGIYLLGTVSELVFIIGFFTKKHDKALIIIFLVFIVLDYFLMQINYFAWSAFLGCLWYSKYKPKT